MHYPPSECPSANLFLDDCQSPNSQLLQDRILTHWTESNLTRYTTPHLTPLSLLATSDHLNYTISRYQSGIHRAYDIVAAIYRTISCTNARLSRMRCSHTAAAASASDWCRSPCTPSVAPSHVPRGRPITQRTGSLGWGLREAVAPVVG